VKKMVLKIVVQPSLTSLQISSRYLDVSLTTAVSGELIIYAFALQDLL